MPVPPQPPPMPAEPNSRQVRRNRYGQFTAGENSNRSPSSLEAQKFRQAIHQARRKGEADDMFDEFLKYVFIRERTDDEGSSRGPNRYNNALTDAKRHWFPASCYSGPFVDLTERLFDKRWLHGREIRGRKMRIMFFEGDDSKKAKDLPKRRVYDPDDLVTTQSSGKKRPLDKERCHVYEGYRFPRLTITREREGIYNWVEKYFGMKRLRVESLEEGKALIREAVNSYTEINGKFLYRGYPKVRDPSTEKEGGENEHDDGGTQENAIQSPSTHVAQIPVIQDGTPQPSRATPIAPHPEPGAASDVIPGAFVDPESAILQNAHAHRHSHAASAVQLATAATHLRPGTPVETAAHHSHPHEHDFQTVVIRVKLCTVCHMQLPEG